MARQNYQFEKRQRDLAKKAKQDEKRRQKLAGKTAADDPPVENPLLPDSPAGDTPADAA